MSTSKKQEKETLPTHGDGGKLSRRRMTTVERTTFTERWDRIFNPKVVDPDGKYEVIRSAIEGMLKKGLTEEAVEREIMKEYGTEITLTDVRELMI